MTALRSLIFNLLYTLWSMFAAVLFAPLLITNDMALRSGHPWARGVFFLAKVCCGIRYEIRGSEYIVDGPVLYASKHQSAWDTIIFWIMLTKPTFVLKKSLLRIPFWGWYLARMKMVAIDRSAGGAGLKDMLKQAKACIAKGRSIIIFPEGTRTKPGAKPDYHPGIIALYSQLKVPVIPVALNSGFYWGRDAFLKKPGTIIIEFLPPIPPGGDKQEFMAKLQPTIENASQKLLDEAKTGV